MSTSYEISIRGSLPAEALTDLGNPQKVEHPAETILVTDPLDPDAVVDLVKHLANLGLELEEVRRLTGPHVPRRCAG